MKEFFKELFFRLFLIVSLVSLSFITACPMIAIGYRLLTLCLLVVVGFALPYIKLKQKN